MKQELYHGHPDQNFGPSTFSQHGEDLLICYLLEQVAGLKKVKYLDLGAHHPLNISNTALLYSRGHRGVNVEANPYLIDEFEKLRPEDKNICKAVNDDQTKGQVTLHMLDMLSGRNSTVKGFLESESLKEMACISVPTITVDKIVDKYCQSVFPDFLSIDLEGLDYEILKSCSFHRQGLPKVICIEIHKNRQPEKTVKFLISKGFRLLLRMSVNLIFVRSDLYRKAKGTDFFEYL